jgi:hypothetical protein
MKYKDCQTMTTFTGQVSHTQKYSKIFTNNFGSFDGKCHSSQFPVNIVGLASLSIKKGE